MQAGRWTILTITLVVVFFIVGCGKKTELEGKLVDGKGVGLAEVTMVAKQVQPVKGYEQFETVTGKDGYFKFKKLFPNSQYTIKPWSEKWAGSSASITVESGPEGKTTTIPAPLNMRYMLSNGGAIADSLTGLEWVVCGNNRAISYRDAVAWVRGCQVDGGGWRMPKRSELRTLYAIGADQCNIDPIFKLTDTVVWAEPLDADKAYEFNFQNGEGSWCFYDNSHTRVFGVRSLQ